MFEQEIKTYLRTHGIVFTDGTTSHSMIDYVLPQLNIALDAKEKTQPFTLRNWGHIPIQQEHLCIVDDLAVRKLLLHAPLSFFIIKDSALEPIMYYVYSIVDLLCIPKRRINRPIERSVRTLKGKWLLDLRDAAAFDDLVEAMEYVIRYKKKFPRIFSTHISCWGRYPSETLLEAGTVRTPGYWKRDARTHK